MTTALTTEPSDPAKETLQASVAVAFISVWGNHWLSLLIYFISGWIINEGLEYASGFSGLTEGEIITEFLNESSFNPDNVTNGVNLELPDWSALLGSEDDYALPDFSLFGRRKREIWESKAYMYSFILTAKRFSDTLKYYNICSLFDELKVRDDGWPQNNFTCREAQARVIHLDRLEELAYIEEKYTQIIKYREVII